MPRWKRSQRHGIELTAWWFPGALNDEAKNILAVIARHRVHPDLWVTGGGAPTHSPQEQAERVEQEAARLRPIAEAAAKQGLRVALYNHGGWFGEPENELAIIARLGLPNVGLVYNFHHGHEHLARFPDLWQAMLGKLWAVNLNGMIPDGPAKGKMILPLGSGTEELAMLRDHSRQRLARAGRHPESSPGAGRRGGAAGQSGGPAKAPPGAGKRLRDHPRGGAASGSPARTAGRRARATASGRARSAGRPRTASPRSPRSTAPTSRSSRPRGPITPATAPGISSATPSSCDGVMYCPTGGGHIAAVDAATGQELWRYQPEKQGGRLEDAPARRGLLYWPGDGDAAARVIFRLRRLDLRARSEDRPAARRLSAKAGRTELPMGGTVGGAVWQHVLVVPGFRGDVFGYDVVNGRELWRFHTIPQPGEPGAETWSRARGRRELLGRHGAR